MYPGNKDIKITFVLHLHSLSRNDAFRVVNLWKLTVDKEGKSIQSTHDLSLSASFENKRNPRDLVASSPAEHLPEGNYQARAIREPRVALPFDQSLITFTCSCIILRRLSTLILVRKRANTHIRASATQRDYIYIIYM